MNDCDCKVIHHTGRGNVGDSQYYEGDWDTVQHGPHVTLIENQLQTALKQNNILKRLMREVERLLTHHAQKPNGLHKVCWQALHEAYKASYNANVELYP